MFKELYEIDVKDKVEQKNGLNYLSWAYAWAEAKKIDEKANYNILRFENNLPYVYDDHTGYMVFTTMTINDITHEMFLPVMDNANKPMLAYEYTYKVKKKKQNGEYEYEEKTVKPATMFDINKTLMRCLTKNIAMFGLGLKLYQGEDSPTVTTKEEAEKIVVNFGKHQGKTLKEILEIDKKYIEWLREKATDENIKAGVELLSPALTKEEQQNNLIKITKVLELAREKNINLEEMISAFKIKRNEINDLTDFKENELDIAIRKLEEK